VPRLGPDRRAMGSLPTCPLAPRAAARRSGLPRRVRSRRARTPTARGSSRWAPT
jgi:hypothetical protein